MNEIGIYTDSGYTMVYGKIYGGKKAFVMLPGVSLTSVLNSIDAIEDGYKVFLDEYTIYVFDNCAKVLEGDSIEIEADRDIKLFDHLNIKDAYVLATSHGGMIAQVVASKRPDLIQKLILASSCMKTNDKRTEVLKKWDEMACNYEIEKLNTDFYQKLFSQEFYDRNYEIIQESLRNGTKEECDNFALTLRTMYDVDISDFTKKIKSKTLAIGAEKDCIFGPDSSLEIAKTIPCDVYIYEGYYHAVYDEAPDYKDRIAEFFKD